MGTSTPSTTVKTVGELVQYIAERLASRTGRGSGIFWYRGHRSRMWSVSQAYGATMMKTLKETSPTDSAYEQALGIDFCRHMIRTPCG
jgi:hypothetical protein